MYVLMYIRGLSHCEDKVPPCCNKVSNNILNNPEVVASLPLITTLVLFIKPVKKVNVLPSKNQALCQLNNN